MKRAADTPAGAGFAGRFADALLDPDRAVPADVCPSDGRAVALRFAVYRNNVTVGLIDALAENFPATRAIVGDQFFRAMARLHVSQSPPRSKLMFEYGRELPAFIERFEPARRLRYLADVARVERAWLDAYHAGDAPAFDIAGLASLAPEKLCELRLTPHPALALVRSRYAIVDIFRANRASGPVGERIDGSRPQIALVTRPHLDVRVEAIAPAHLVFVEAMASGETLANAIERAVRRDDDLDVASMLAITIGAGAFAAASNGMPAREI